MGDKELKRHPQVIGIVRTLLPIIRWWILVRETLVSHVGSEQKCQQSCRRVLLHCCASVTKVRVWQLEVFERFRGVSEHSRRRPDSHTAPHQAALVFLQNTNQKMTENLQLILQSHVFIIFPFENRLWHCIYQKNTLVVAEISQSSQKLASPNDVS